LSYGKRGKIGERSLTSLERMVGILDLYEGQKIEWTIEDLSAHLGLTRSTLYRYLKVLTDAGLLTSLPDIGYMLGPRIAELDFHMRQFDPLIGSSRPVMAQLADQFTGIALLCRRYRDRVLCVHQVQKTASFQSNYQRGKAQPLLKGAASRIILAHLPATHIRRIYEAQPHLCAQAGWGDNLEAFRMGLRKIRQTGWDTTSADVTPNVTGIAAPIFDGRGTILASLSLTIGQPDLPPDRLKLIADQVVFGARIVTHAMAHHQGESGETERTPAPR
jgi:DNA-binding IclR family transcriptional regulator